MSRSYAHVQELLPSVLAMKGEGCTLKEIANHFGLSKEQGYRQVLCANSFTNLAELCLHKAGKSALDCPIAEGRVSVKGGEAACEALDASFGFCYQPTSSSCPSRCFMLMYFLPPHWVPAT